MERKTIGLALSGGGARAFAQVGVLKALVDNDIPIDYLAGSSAGSLVGAAFASGLSPDEIMRRCAGMKWSRLSRLSYSTRGILTNAKMKFFIEKDLGCSRFEDLKIPFAAVACDLESGEEIILKGEGDLARAVRASCAIPGIFTPIPVENGRFLVDGGVVSPIPINAIKTFNPDIIVAVDIFAFGHSLKAIPKSLFGALIQSTMLLLRSGASGQHIGADVVIIPDVGRIGQEDLGKIDELFELGFAAGEAKVPEIKRLLDANDSSIPAHAR